MKKVWPLFCFFALSLALMGCENGTVPPSANGSSPSPPTEPTVNRVSEFSSALPNPKTEAEETDTAVINFGEQISLPFVEITIDGASVGDEILPDHPKQVYRYSGDVEGEKYFYVYGTIKNISGNQFEFASNTFAAMCFDDTYNYDAQITADEGGTFSYIYGYLDPLKSEKFYITASVPDELIQQYTHVDVKFGFKTNFEPEYGIQEFECDHLFTIPVSQ